MEIKEDYVSFEVAKLLKEKKFKEKVRALWIGGIHPYLSVSGIKEDDYNSGGTDLCSAPTHQMACDWVRSKGWHIETPLSYDDDNKPVYYVVITSVETFLAADIGELEDMYFPTVGEATEEALKYCLENLI